MVAAKDVCFTPATVLAAAIRARELSPVEVLDAVLARVEQVNPKLNAFTVVLADEARAAARQAEQAVTRGEPLGPLHGVPFTIKDLTFTKGVKTMRGSKAFADFVPEENAIVVDRLLAAGGIFIGKTTTPEFGNKGVTESPLTGVTNNPWKTTHIAGGSSGGAAAAVAAGLAPIAEGSDGAGSIRIPASCCGVVGFKPSFGRVPSFPPVPFQSLAHQGPITRTVADAALMLNVIAGPDDRVPFSIAERDVDYLAAIESASVRGLRVAYSRDLGLGPVEPEVTARTDAAATLFAASLGAEVEEVTLDLSESEEILTTMWCAIMGTNVEDLLLPRLRLDEIDPAIIAFYERAKTMHVFEYFRAAYPRRGEFYRRVTEFFTRYDLLLTPTLKTPPFPHPGWQPGPETVAGRPLENRLLGWLLTYPFNLTGQPAVTVPCGFSSDGVPIGLQIVGRRHADVAVLRAAAAYEQAAPWAQLRPDL